MPDGRRQWHFPVQPRVTWTEAQGQELVVPETAVYRMGVRWRWGDAAHAIFDHQPG